MSATLPTVPPADRAEVPCPLSANEVYLLSRPEVTLYVNRSPESSEALETLGAVDLTAAIVPSPRRQYPVAKWGGLTFRGLAAIRGLARMVGAGDTALDAALERAAPHIPAPSDPALRAWMAAFRQRQLGAARTALSEFPRGPVARRRLR